MTSLTVPTIITITRIGLTFPVTYLIFVGEMEMAFIVYVIAAASDFLDGFVARRLNQKSNLGAMLDHVADKILVISVLFMLAATNYLSASALIASLLIIVRELLILGLREYVSMHSQKPVVVLSSAKWKTALTMMALAFLMLQVERIGELFLWLSVMMSLVSSWNYIRQRIPLS